MPENKDVVLSVIITTGDKRDGLSGSLECVLKGLRPESEVIIAERLSDKSSFDRGNYLSKVIRIKASAEAKLPELLGEAIIRSSGDIIAITDSATIVDENWAESILKAHAATDAPVIAGTVEAGTFGSITNWAAFFCDYAQFMPPAKSRTVAAVPGNNISLKRPALELGSEHVKPEFRKSLWCAYLRRNGIELLIDPAIRVYSEKRYKLRELLADRFRQGRDFAAARTGIPSRVPRGAYAAGSLLLPILFIARVVLTAARKKRHLAAFLLSLPVILLIALFWSAGECAGYAFGRAGTRP